MSWSNKWPDPKLDPVEAAKIADDAVMHGTGYHKDGKHIPLEEVYIAPTKTTFHFQDGNKRRSIDVTIVGDLALDYDDDGWNIYHVPTGTVFTKAVPAWNMAEINGHINELYSYEPSELLAWMKKVQEKHDISWTMLRLLTPDNYQDKGDSAKRIIKEWCLSVPVKE